MNNHDPRTFRLAVGAYIVMWGLLASPWLLGYVTIPYDAKAHFQAQIQFLATALHSGQSPFWSPNVFAGTPQIADPQSMIFSPAIVLAYFEAVPSFRQVDAYVLGLLGLGGLAVLWLFKDRRWHPAGGLIAALAFAFGASASWRVQHIGQVQSYALFGIALLFLDRALRRNSSGYGLAAGLAAGLMLVEPDQVALLGCYVLIGLVLERWFGQGGLRLNFVATLKPLALGTVAGIAVAGLPLLLTYLFVSDSNRPSILVSEAVRGSLHPASLLTFVVSDLFGAFDPKVDYWGPFSSEWDPNELSLSQNMSQVYIGALPALLVLAVGLRRRLIWAREVRIFTLAAAGLLIYAIGRHTPVYALLYEFLPGVSYFRRPADATFLLGAMLAILAGYVMHRSVMSERTRSVGSHFGAAALISLAVIAAVALAAQMGKLDLAWRPVLLAVCWLGASAAVVFAVPRLASRRTVFAVLLPAALLTVDLAANNGPNESTALPVEQYDVLKPGCKNPTIKLLKSLVKQPSGSARRDRVELTGLGFDWPNASLVHGIDHVLGYNPLRLDVVSQAIGAGDTIAGPDQRNFTPLFPSYRSRLADLLGLRYIAASVPIEEIDTRLGPGSLPLIARTGDAYVYENADALPRAMYLTQWQIADFTAMLRTGEWPADPASTVLLEAMPAGVAGAFPNSMRDPQTEGESDVRILRYENTIVEIEVDSAAPGFLVLNDVWHPWWEADIEGRPVPILKANVLFRAVELPAGRHVVHFEFRPIKKALELVAQKTSNAAQQLSFIPSVRAEPWP